MTSANAFNTKADSMLHGLSLHPDGLTIGTVNIDDVIVADDLVLSSSNQYGIQSLIDVVEHDACL